MFYLLMPFAAFFMEGLLIWALLRVWKKRPAYLVLLLCLISIAIWSILVGGLRYSSTLEQAMVWERFIFPVLPLVSLLIFHFCFLFTGEGRSKAPLIALYVTNLSAFLLSLTPLILQGVQLRSYGYAPVTAPLGSLWFASIYIPPVWGIVLLARYYGSSHLPEERNRTLYLLVGMGFLLAGGVTDWVAALGKFPYPMGMVGHIVLSTLITVAVIRYHLFDIRPYFYSVAAYAIAGGLVASSYAAVWIILNSYLGATSLFIVAPLSVVVFPITRRLQEVLAASFNRTKFQNSKLLDDFARDSTNILDLNQLANHLTSVAATVMTAKPVHLYLYNAERKMLEPIVSTGGDHHQLPSFHESSLFASRLRALDRPLTAGELLSDPVLQFLPDDERSVMAGLKGQLFFPLKSQHRLVGLMVLGEKASWETYNRREIGLLSKVTQQAAMAVDNARLYSDALRARDNLEIWLNGMSDSVMIVGAESRIQFMSKTATRHLGDSVGAICWQVLGVGGRCPWCPAQMPTPAVEQTGQTAFPIRGRLFDISAAPLVNPDGSGSIIEVLRDVTERERAEEERRDMERKAQVTSRLATVGEMASGIAHEINNPLTGVIGFAQLLKKETMPPEQTKYVSIINDGAERVAAIVKRLLVFARQQKPERRPVDINEILETTIQLRSYEMKTNNIEVTTQFDRNLPRTMADGGQLQQVFLNIIINAEKEMKAAHGKGGLLIKTEVVNGRIAVSLVDDGPGIARENLEKIFTPFFSTRRVGEGTGLGLSVCWGIVTEHNGKISAASEEGHGATFLVELPIVSQPDPQQQLEPGASADVPPMNVVKGNILVVDDDIEVRQLLSKVLGADGHSVSSVDNASDGLEMIQRHKYNLLLLDIKLPGISGIQLYRRMREMSLDLAAKTIFITGDAMGAETRDFLAQSKVTYVTKPFDIVDLKKQINAMLSGA